MAARQGRFLPMCQRDLRQVATPAPGDKANGGIDRLMADKPSDWQCADAAHPLSFGT